ncbi:helix-turn-helix domain-containing protein [Streptococcus sobrinus]|mgnify:CR=1 FL=1|uniref:Transcriptional regulator in cluster with unspecified monosaccharide ABC transporter n=2 Tax=Streptococcus sobrinus TaxID=1310 RepID=A0ABM6W818_9STRE|nr:helix-turn-helix domain-containing protein [Streptococcus sobrinus]AWN21746.1 transcriptional regulator in cluster with unspecified monosaccharide ABC transporter [Streptococcus sobrinus]OZV22144.1 transcriptional regulator in cluster with unspecified monosaccharide ABC transporter [Streptococcus sobrinus]SQG14598.1 putative membrane associated protein [Streptococcus sobrinus]
MKKVSIGEYLQRARLAKDLKVEEVSVELNIPMQYITVMEHNQFQFLTREKADAYLKAYTEFLDLDSEPLLEGYGDPDFRLEVEEKKKEEPLPEPEEEQTSKVVEPFTKWSRSDRFEYLKNPKRRLPLVIMSLLSLLVLGLIGSAVYLQVSDEMKKASLPSSSLHQEKGQAQADSSAASDSKLSSTTKGSNISVTLADKNDQVTVEISQDSDQENLVCVTNSNLDKKGVTLDGNTKDTKATLDSKADKSVITLTSIDNVTVKINDQTLDLSSLAKDNTSYITLTIK